MHVSKMVYITRWKEAGSYQHGDCLPHTGGQTGQDVTGILLVGSSSRDVCLYFPSQQFFLKGQSNLQQTAMLYLKVAKICRKSLV